MRKRLQKLGPVLAVTLLLFTHATVFAETGSIGIIPAFPKEDNLRSKSIFIHTLKGGESVDDGVRVFNYTKEARTVKIDAVDSIAGSDGSFSCKQNSEKKTAVGSWIKVAKNEVTIPAQSNETVAFTISVPAKVSPGEHGACITAQDTRNEGAKKGSGIILGFRNAIRMAITVPGKIVKELTITKIEIARNEKGNYTVSPVSRNSGNVSLDVTSRVQLRSMFGQETKVQKASYPVIAGATTGWAFEFKRPYWGGFYKAYTSIAYDADPTSGLGDKVGDEKKARRDTGYFFMLPTPQAMAIEAIVPLLLAFILVTYVRRRHLRRVAPKRLSKYVVQPSDTIMSIAKANTLGWKRLARVNGLRAPYLLEEGQTLLLPNAKKRLPRKGLWRKKDTWIVDDTVAESSDKADVEPAPQQVRDARMVQSTEHYPTETVAVHDDWVAPRSASPERYPVPAHIPNPSFPEPEDIDIPDWREGASEEELVHLGYLRDDSSIPQLSSALNIYDEPAETAHKPKKDAPKSRKKPTKKPVKRSSKNK